MNKESAKLTGVILAGGQNRRMNGRSKALLTIGGQTFLSRQLSEMSRVCSELLLIAPDRTPFERELEPYGERVRIEADLHPGLGPLAGLETAMTMALGEVLWVVGCDMPFLSADAAVALEELRQQERTELAVPRLGEKLHPLHGVYHRCGLPVLQSMLTEGNFRVMDFIGRMNASIADGAFFEDRGVRTDFAQNINNPDDYVRMTSDHTKMHGPKE